MIKALFKKIVVAVNGSEKSINALKYAIVMAKLYHLQLRVVYVIDTCSIKKLLLTKFFVKSEADRINEQLEFDGQKYLAYSKSLAESKSIKVELDLRRGAVFSEIVRSANEFSANIIILGSCNNNSCLEIMENAPCNVLAVNESHIEQVFKMA